MAVVRVYWDLDPSRLEEEFQSSRDEGFRVRSIAMYGPPGAPLYAVLWYLEGGPRQFLRAGLSGTEFLEYANGIPEPFRRPALVTGTGEGAGARWTLVLETWSARGAPTPGRAPSMTWAMPWSTFRNHVHGLPPGFYVRSADVVGTRNTEDGGALNFAATVWPCADNEPWHQSGVRLDDAVQDPGEFSGYTTWKQTSATKRMSAQAAPWFVTPVPASNGHRPRVFSLWNDRIFHPWPDGNPFLPRQDFKVDGATAANVDRVFGDTWKWGHVLPLAVGAAGPDLASARFQIVWVPASRPDGLKRRFLRDGPGDGRHSIRQPLERVRPSFLAISRFGALYRELELRPGHVLVRPRDPTGDDLLDVPVGMTHRELESAASHDPGYMSAADHTSPTVAPPPTVNWHRFDAVMRSHFMGQGARAAQLCVLRNGRLVFARAYTSAEEGYPITRLHHRFRIGSVSKAITGTWFVHRVRPAGGLNDVFASYLNVMPRLTKLRSATVSEALRHATGLDAEADWLAPNIVTQYANGAQDEDDVDPESHPVFEQPGTMREWYERLDVADAAPFERGTTWSYNNWVFACLGEALSALVEPESYGQIHRVASELIRQVGGQTFLNSDIRGGQSYAQCRHRGEVPYHDVPLVQRNTYQFEAPDLEGEWSARPYTFPMELVGAAGGWAMSAVDVAYFLRGLTIRPGITSIVSADDLAAIRLKITALPGQGLAWQVSSKNWWVPGTGYRDRVLMWHNGALFGASSLVFHMFDAANPGDTLSMVVVRNQAPGPLGEADARALLDVAEDIEIAGGWPTGDLFLAL